MLADEALKSIIRRLLLNDKVSKETILITVFNTAYTTLTGYERGSTEFYEAMIEEAIEQTKGENDEK